MYSNLIGCDGERVYYDGCCIIALNGEVKNLKQLKSMIIEWINAQYHIFMCNHAMYDNGIM